MPAFTGLRVFFLRWAVLLAAVVLLIGVANLALVHWNKIKSQQKDFAYSLTLIVSLILTLVVGTILGPTTGLSMWIFKYVQIPIESSLMAILAVVLAYTGARLLKRRLDIFTLIFVGTVFVILIGTITFPGFELPILQDVRNVISNVFAVGGARGILLGVGLGTLATGLRILVGADRPYGD